MKKRFVWLSITIGLLLAFMFAAGLAPAPAAQAAGDGGPQAEDQGILTGTVYVAKNTDLVVAIYPEDSDVPLIVVRLAGNSEGEHYYLRSGFRMRAWLYDYAKGWTYLTIMDNVVRYASDLGVDYMKPVDERWGTYFNGGPQAEDQGILTGTVYVAKNTDLVVAIYPEDSDVPLIVVRLAGNSEGEHYYLRSGFRMRAWLYDYAKGWTYLTIMDNVVRYASDLGVDYMKPVDERWGTYFMTYCESKPEGTCTLYLPATFLNFQP
ncbi:MAG: hypothetical protein ACOZAN_04035 [Patescibacteria group bacterium]